MREAKGTLAFTYSLTHHPCIVVLDYPCIAYIRYTQGISCSFTLIVLDRCLSELPVDVASRNWCGVFMIISAGWSCDGKAVTESCVLFPLGLSDGVSMP